MQNSYSIKHLYIIKAPIDDFTHWTPLFVDQHEVFDGTIPSSTLLKTLPLTASTLNNLFRFIALLGDFYLREMYSEMTSYYMKYIEDTSPLNPFKHYIVAYAIKFTNNGTCFIASSHELNLDLVLELTGNSIDILESYNPLFYKIPNSTNSDSK